MKKRTVLLAGLAAAMMMAVPALAEDAVITEPLDFVTNGYSNPDSNYYTWDASTQTLTLKDGFKMDVELPTLYSGAINVPDGTTIIMEGSAEIDCENHAGIYSKGDFTIRNGSLDIETDVPCIYSEYGSITIENSTLDLFTDGYYEYGYYDGIYAYDNITITDSDLTVESYEDCIESEYGSITIENSTLDLAARCGEDGSSGEGIYAGDDITINNSTLTVFSEEEEGIYAENDITIDNSTLNIISEDEEGINSSAGFITIDNSKIKVISDDECIDANTGLAITNTSLDLTSTDGDGVLDVANDAYENNLSLDSKFVLYNANGKRLTSSPIKYTINLINFDDGEAWYYGSQKAYRLVTAADTSIYIEKTLGSLKTVSFSGDGAEALDGLVRAFGSTINLTKIVPESREGYTFTGWYADPACTKPITKLVVTGNMEIYAGWELIPVEEETAEETAETAVEAAAE